jgi:type I restriction enzyme S subunit
MEVKKLKELVSNEATGYGKEVGANPFELPVVKVSNVSGDGFFHKSFELRSFTGKDKQKLIAKDGDLFVVKSSGSKTNILSGKTALYEENGIELIASNFLLRLSPIKEISHPKYIWYYLNSKKTKSFIKSIVGTTTYPNLKWSLYGDMKIPLPTIETQQYIATILDEARAFCNKTKQLIKEYDLLAQSIFLDMFGDPVKNPKSWSESNIEKVCIKILGGGTPRKSNEEYFNGDIPWVTPKDMKRLYIKNSKIKITEKAVSESSVKLIPKDSILMVIRSGILKKKLPVAISTSEVTINQDMKAFIANTNIINPKYLMFFFLNAQKYLLAKVRAVTADNIEFNQIKQMKIPLPNLDIQNQFAEKIALIEQQKEMAKEELQESEDLFNCLLQKAFKGELV